MSETNPAIVETREIPVKDGQILTVEMSQRFIDHLRQHFGLLESQRLEDDHVRAYVLESVNNAVVKAEREHKDVGPTADATNVHRPRRRKKDARG